jgi:hypothetical protein
VGLIPVDGFFCFSCPTGNSRVQMMDQRQLSVLGLRLRNHLTEL